jgi:hypothetical protein
MGARHRMAHEDGDDEAADLTPASWLKFGQRNILYIGFVALLIPFGMALDGRRPAGTQTLGGFGFALMLCVAVSTGFFVINAGLFVVDLAKGRRVAKALIGCALPILLGLGSVLIRRLTL